MTKKRLIKILRKAADLLDERGWCRWDLEDEKGRLCILGALDRVGFDFAHEPEEALGFVDTSAMVDWNNAIARDNQMIIVVAPGKGASMFVCGDHFGAFQAEFVRKEQAH